MTRVLQQGYAKKTQPETLIRRAITETLRLDGWDVTYHQQGPMCRKGFPDLTALKDGVTIYIEIKTPKGVQSAYQVEFERICKAHGGTYVLARCVDDIKPYLTSIKPIF